jgi:parallel beta-helix repeat protein
MRKITTVLSIMAGVLSLTLAVDSFDRSWATDCFEVFRGPGSFTVDSDVGPCPGAGISAIEVRGPATLNVAGHTISCDGTSIGSSGIQVFGDKVTVHGGNGTVMNCDAGVDATGDHQTISKINAVNNFFGFVITGRKVMVTRSHASGNGGAGFLVSGDSHTLTRNTAADNSLGFQIDGTDILLKKNTADNNLGTGFEILDDSNRLIRNSATGNDSFGFDIGGSDNRLKWNHAIGNQVTGFLIESDSDFNTLKHNAANNNLGAGIGINASSAFNVVTHNKATGNIFIDLIDGSFDCTSNTWKKNKFVTSDPACIR